MAANDGSSTVALSARTTTVMLLASVLPLIDSSLVNVLLPVVSNDLGAPKSSAQLGVSGYMLAATVGIILSTTCIRRFGTRRVWLGSVVAFAAASAAVGLAANLPVFVIARVVQGTACGFIMPAVQQVVVQTVGREGMRSALATIGLPAVVAPAVGPLLGGIFVDAVGWRTLFLVNVPVAVIALVLAPAVLPRDNGNRVPLGLGQAVPAVLGMVGLLWVVSGAGSLPLWAVVVILGLSAVLVAVFTALDLRSTTPLLDLSLYRGLSFAAVMVLCLVVGAVFYGTLLSTSLHVQGDLGQPAWIAGVLLGVQGVGAWAARSLIKGPWSSANAFVVIGSGLLVAAVGTLGVQSVGSWSAVAVVLLVLCSLVRGLGLGACTLLALSAAYEVVDEAQTAAVGAHTRLMLQFGGALGTAVAGAWVSSAVGLGAAVAVVAACGAAAAGGVLLRTRRASAPA
ncbi:MFS transporter [Corynebacterium sp.]|uniref:MFS transporter n=1 Tax=Corynebacterium sp. TaxID=1720 RepID=UPI0028A901AB|nr:MFS transporter [Corynebacterium sp.]